MPTVFCMPGKVPSALPLPTVSAYLPAPERSSTVPAPDSADAEAVAVQVEDAAGDGRGARWSSRVRRRCPVAGCRCRRGAAAVGVRASEDERAGAPSMATLAVAADGDAEGWTIGTAESQRGVVGDAGGVVDRAGGAADQARRTFEWAFQSTLQMIPVEVTIHALGDTDCRIEASPPDGRGSCTIAPSRWSQH